MWAPRGKKCHEKKQPKNLATTGAHRLCCLQASRTWTLSLSEPFPEVLMTAQTSAVENVDFAQLLTYHAHFRSRPLTTVVVWLHDHGARPCWWLPIDSIKVQNDDMQKQHCPGRHGHPMCTCKATAGSAKVERSSQQASVGQGLLLARKGNGRRMAWLVLLLTALIVLFCK